MSDRTLALCDKVLAVVCFALSAATQASLEHDLAALFFSILFLLLGIYQFWLGVVGHNRTLFSEGIAPPPAPIQESAPAAPRVERRRTTRRNAQIATSTDASSEVSVAP